MLSVRTIRLSGGVVTVALSRADLLNMPARDRKLIADIAAAFDRMEALQARRRGAVASREDWLEGGGNDG